MSTPCQPGKHLPVTRGQLVSLIVRLKEFGLASRDGQLGYCSSVVGRPIESRKHLSALEASCVLDLLDEQLGSEVKR